MTTENKDVDLYDELAKTLESAEDEDTSGASAEKKPEEKKEVVTPEKDDDQGAELSEEEISKLSPRAQKRIREQAAEITRLASLTPPEEKKEEAPADDKKKPDSQDFKSVQDFLAAVEDEPSRNLLEKFYSVIKGEISTTLSPIEQKNNEARFESEFAQYAEIDGLADHKDDLRKTFMRNPNQSVKALVGEVVTDLQMNKVKPVEKTPSSPKHGGKVTTDNLSKDELYTLLDQGID